jgi:hypothetical protein
MFSSGFTLASSFGFLPDVPSGMANRRMGLSFQRNVRRIATVAQTLDVVDWGRRGRRTVSL